MTHINLIIVAISWFFFGSGLFILFACFVGFLRAGDFFVKMHAIKISNIYGTSFVLIGVFLQNCDLLIFLQLFMIIILNILTTIVIVHTASRMAMNENLPHNAISRKKYNEYLAQEEEKLAKQAQQHPQEQPEVANEPAGEPPQTQE
jgi:monovalent cation/proton antiporter MnhG/PhaG subunit